MNTERKDTDHMLVLIAYGYDDSVSVTNLLMINMILFGTVNLIISIVGIYYIPTLLRQGVSYFKRDSNLLTTKELNEVYTGQR